MHDACIPYGVSREANQVEQALERGRSELNELNSVGKKAALDELKEVWSECKQADWDGLGAAPVTWETYYLADVFIKALPFGTPVPSVGAEADGHLTLEWYASKRRVLSVSISPDGDLYYAAFLGPRTMHGSEALFGDVPDQILRLVKQVYG